MKLLSICAALAAGEGLAAQVPSCAESWPLFVLLALFVLLLGYGIQLRGWVYPFVFISGIALFFVAAVPHAHDLRARPWMKDARRFAREENSRDARCAIQRDLSRRVGLGLERKGETADLNRAILLGERQRIPRMTKRMFVDSGTVHIFAISGLHVMVVANVLSFFLGCAWVPIRWQGFAALAPLWLYVILIGAPPSAVRAATMASFYFGATLVWRRPDGLNAWSLAFLLMHVLGPLQITDAGSLLSFTVMLALVLASRLLRRIRKGWWQALFFSFAAWAAGVPIAAHTFGRVTTGSLLANAILLPTAACSVAGSAVGVLASFISTEVAAHINNLSALFTEMMVVVATCVARLPGVCLVVPPWSFAMCAAWYIALSLLFWLLARRPRCI